MLRIAKSLLTILAVAIVAVGATGAYFSDNVTVANNQFESGALDIIWSGSASSALTLNNMEPGVWYGDEVTYPAGAYRLEVFNHTINSTMAAKYRFTATNTGGSSALYDMINVKVYRYEGTGSWGVSKWSGKLKDMLVDPTVVAAMGNLPVSDSHDWKFAFQLDPLVDNSYANLTTVFDLNYDATQASNLGW